MCTVRNDIMVSVKELPRGLSERTEDHLLRMKHLLRYSQGRKNVTQTLRPTFKLHPHHHSLDINVYVDSDWAGCTHARRSTSGVAVFVLGANVFSHLRTQATVALSSGEAELPSVRGLRCLIFETACVGDLLVLKSALDCPHGLNCWGMHGRTIWYYQKSNACFT